MSNIKRYYPCREGEMHEGIEGEFVLYEDYQDLRMSKAAVELEQQNDKLTADNAALVEALEKARVKLEAATSSTNGMIKAVFTEEALLILKDCKLESKHG